MPKTLTFIQLPPDQQQTYQILPSPQPHPFKPKISNQSPIPKPLIPKPLNHQLPLPLPNPPQINLKILQIK
ncbi:GreA/GreB family elongation factor [Staphylococcus epidermidis]|uniref:GreA/GreB family elongation factor n=1 Tax=Staphylococcus epidermidis TaxID=1282 RepID=UPI0037DA6D10